MTNVQAIETRALLSKAEWTLKVVAMNEGRWRIVAHNLASGEMVARGVSASRSVPYALCRGRMQLRPRDRTRRRTLCRRPPDRAQHDEGPYPPLIVPARQRGTLDSIRTPTFSYAPPPTPSIDSRVLSTAACNLDVSPSRDRPRPVDPPQRHRPGGIGNDGDRPPLRDALCRNFSVQGNVLVSAMAEDQVKQVAKDQAENVCPINKESRPRKGVCGRLSVVL